MNQAFQGFQLAIYDNVEMYHKLPGGCVIFVK